MTERKPTEVYTGTGTLVPAVVGLIVLIPILENFKDETRHYVTDEFIIREVFYDGLVKVEELDTNQPPIEVLGIYCTIKGTTEAVAQEATA